MTPAARDRDAGSSMIESLVLAVVMILPLAFAIAVFGSIQRAAIATSAAAREAGRAYVTAPNASEAAARSEAAVEGVLSAHRLDRGRAEIRITGGLTRGGAVTVEVFYRTPAASIPLLAEIPVVTVGARHVELVDRHRSVGGR